MKYQTYNYHNKEIRIYKWENKPIKDFPIPKGFRIIEFNEFNELIEKKIIKLEVWISYFVKHWNKQMREKGFMSGVYLSSSGYLFSDSYFIDYSYVSGWVVIIK
jgi:hypothetical protein